MSNNHLPHFPPKVVWLLSLSLKQLCSRGWSQLSCPPPPFATICSPQFLSRPGTTLIKRFCLSNPAAFCACRSRASILNRAVTISCPSHTCTAASQTIRLTCMCVNMRWLYQTYTRHQMSSFDDDHKFIVQSWSKNRNESVLLCKVLGNWRGAIIIRLLYINIIQCLT